MNLTLLMSDASAAAPKIATKADGRFWSAVSPGKRWTEVFFLLYSPFWIIWALCILVPFKLYDVTSHPMMPHIIHIVMMEPSVCSSRAGPVAIWNVMLSIVMVPMPYGKLASTVQTLRQTAWHMTFRFDT